MRIKKFSKKHEGVFKKLGVSVIYLFGSQAEKTAHPLSDADFGVVFSDAGKYREQPLEIYSELYNVFLEVLPKEYLQKRLAMRAHEFDIVFLQFSSPRMQYRAAEDGVVLYKSSPQSAFDFKEKAMSTYFDFKYFERLQSQAFLAATSPKIR